MERLLQDLRFTARLLWKDRAFASTALLTLGVCIGTNAAIFAIVNSVLLRPLPVPEPERLVLIYNSYPRAGVERASNGVPDYYDRLREVDVFEETPGSSRLEFSRHTSPLRCRVTRRMPTSEPSRPAWSSAFARCPACSSQG